MSYMSTKHHTTTDTLTRLARKAIADLSEAIEAGFDDDLIEAFGDQADDLIDQIAGLDLGVADRLARELARV